MLFRSGYFQGENYVNAEYLARKGFYIPSGMALTEKQMEIVVTQIKRIMDELCHSAKGKRV